MQEAAPTGDKHDDVVGWPVRVVSKGLGFRIFLWCDLFFGDSLSDGPLWDSDLSRPKQGPPFRELPLTTHNRLFEIVVPSSKNPAFSRLLLVVTIVRIVVISSSPATPLQT